MHTTKSFFAQGLLCCLAILTVSGAFAQGTFSSAGSLSTHRYRTKPVRLNDGRVFVAGGQYIDTGTIAVEGSTPPSHTYHALASAEVFDPATGATSSVAGLGQARFLEGVTVMNDGRVAIIGGTTNESSGQVGQIEIYNPQTNSTSLVGTFTNPRYRCTATALADGRVLLVGGTDGASSWPLSYVVFSFSQAGVSQTTIAIPSGNSSTPRYSNKVVGLNDGRVLIAGGRNTSGTGTISAKMYLFDPATDSISAAPDMSAPRAEHTVTLMADGRVFICGGHIDSGTTMTKSCDIFDPATGTIVATYQMYSARANHWTALLGDGKILIAGEEIFDPATGSFSLTNSTPAVSRGDGHAVPLLDGRVFISGGITSGLPQLQNELFVPTGWNSNQPPVANAGSNVIAYVGSATTGAITLNGTGSSDPNGQALSYAWTGSFGTATGATPTVTLPIGINRITLTVTDSGGATATAEVIVAVVQGTDAAGYTQLQGQVQDLTAQLAAANAQITTLTSQNQSLQAQLADANAQIAALNAQIASLTTANQQLTQKVASLTTLLQSLLTAFDQIQSAATSINTISVDKKTAINQALAN